jgi:hypothetical protein
LRKQQEVEKRKKEGDPILMLSAQTIKRKGTLLNMDKSY